MNRRTPIKAQCHRFHDAVAVYIGNGETVYLSPREARQLTRAINKIAKSCDNEGFAESSGLTAEFTFSDIG